MASQHGVRAALRWKDSSGKTTSKATPVVQQNKGETSKTSASAQKNTTKNTLVNEGNNDSSLTTKKKCNNKPKGRIIDTAEDQQRWWNKMKDSGEWEVVSNLSKPTLRNMKSGNLVQKSREKWEIEVYDKRGNHIGVIKPGDGTFHPELMVKERKI